MLKIGLLGVGHLGKIHLKCLQLLPERYEIVGFFDPDDDHASWAVETYGISRFTDLDQLIASVDVLDIVTPTTTHYELARKGLLAGKHLFIEKPVTNTLSEAEELLELARRKQLKVQVGHVERFNPALLSLSGISLRPVFVESHRLATFNPRGTDVSVVLDLMIHDLDILLNIVRSEVISISAGGTSVVSDTPDICNARLEFANGCVANLTASRISLKQMRKMRMFQQDAYISVDFFEKQAQIVRLFEKDAPDLPASDQLMELPTPAGGSKWLHLETPDIEPVNAIKMELETFADSIEKDLRPEVSLEDGYNALKVAYQIMEDMERRLKSFQKEKL